MFGVSMVLQVHQRNYSGNNKEDEKMKSFRFIAILDGVPEIFYGCLAE